MSSIERRKLNNKHRLMMANLATETFIDESLRAAEAKAREAFVEAVTEAAAAVPEQAMAVFRDYGQVSEINHIYVCNSLIVQHGSRSFEKPNGEIVERESTVIYKMSAKNPIVWTAWHETSGIRSGRTMPLVEQGRWREIKLPSPIVIPGYSVEVRDDGCVAGPWGRWFTPARPALIAWFKAMRDRIESEARLLQAALKLIAASSLYGEVLSVWPEVRALEVDMFGEANLTKTALICLNDNDRALLCDHMSRRGVASAICHKAAHVEKAA